jgi:hypothetical protein
MKHKKETIEKMIEKRNTNEYRFNNSIKHMGKISTFMKSEVNHHTLNPNRI